MSQRLVRFALLASATSLLSYGGTAFAQVPIFLPEPVATPAEAGAPAVGDVSPPAPPPPTIEPAAGVAPPPPLGVRASPSSPAAPQPAKAEVISEPQRPPPPAVIDTDDDDRNDDAPDTSRHRHWYGWQTLIADGASFATVLAAGSLNGQGGNDHAATTLAWSGLLSYELTPGIIHFIHKNPGRAFASMGLRVGLPLTGAFIGLSAASGCNDGLFCEAEGAGVGVLLGMAGAVALDAALLAFDDPRPRQPNRSALVPLVSVTHRQAWVGIGGDL